MENAFRRATAVCDLRAALGLGEPYDPDVAIFGLKNAVFAIGDQFLEVVSPVREGSAGDVPGGIVELTIEREGPAASHAMCGVRVTTLAA